MNNHHPNEKSYGLLLQKIEELEPLGFLSGFKTDLTKHDRIALELVKENCPFLWAVRKHGTWMLTKEDFLDPVNTEHYVESCFSCMYDFFVDPGYEEYKVFHYDGENLKEIKDNNSGRQILQSWQKENK